jgi:hypothetical protein
LLSATGDASIVPAGEDTGFRDLRICDKENRVGEDDEVRPVVRNVGGWRGG